MSKRRADARLERLQAGFTTDVQGSHMRAHEDLRRRMDMLNEKVDELYLRFGMAMDMLQEYTAKTERWMEQLKQFEETVRILEMEQEFFKAGPVHHMTLTAKQDAVINAGETFEIKF